MSNHPNNKNAAALGAVLKCIRILWPWKASEKTPSEVIPHVCVKYRRTLQEKENNQIKTHVTLRSGKLASLG
jgi:hypothetical protein